MNKETFEHLDPEYKNKTVETLLSNMEALTEVSEIITKDEGKKKKKRKLTQLIEDSPYSLVGSSISALAIAGTGAVGIYALTKDDVPVMKQNIDGLDLRKPISKIKGTNAFREIAPKYMDRLKQDFNLTDVQAAGILGNLGHESGGFTVMQEIKPTKGRGGLGYAQWTGPRRVKFEELARETGMSYDDPELNYLMLRTELETHYKKTITKLRTAKTIKEAVYIFERGFERSGDVNRQGVIVKQGHYNKRYEYAQKALELNEHHEYTKEISQGSPYSYDVITTPKQEKTKNKQISTSTEKTISLSSISPTPSKNRQN